MSETSRRSMLKLAGSMGLLAASRPVLAQQTQMMMPTPADWLDLTPDSRGIVRFGIDVAVIGNSDAIDPSGRIGPSDSQDYFNIDVRGDSYQVEGALYPGGTIPKASVMTQGRPGGKPSVQYQINWDFKDSAPVGHWLSRGWVLINGNREPATDTRGTVIETARTEPHLLSEHNYVFGRFSPDDLSPEMLISSGTEDGNDVDKEVLVRAITGGTGRFKFVTGQVVERRNGRNSSVLRSFSNFPGAYAPNYRFDFELKLG